MSKLWAVTAAAIAVVAAVFASQAPASRGLQVGVMDDAQIFGNADWAFPQLRRLRAQVIRVNLYWPNAARRRPQRATDPADEAYNWDGYDQVVRRAAENRIKVMFTIVGTPRWANGGKPPNRAPRRATDLRNFAYAAAKRYSGSFKPDTGDDEEEPKALPAVRLWLAWNEPNNPVFLSPQFRRVRRGWVIQSARDYAKICNAVVAGVRATLLRGEKIGCGVTGPRGNNRARSSRPSVSPVFFMRAMKKAGARGFTAYAHHPYYGRPTETPGKPPAERKTTAITLGNINILISELTRLYGRKPLWVTEYAYQTRPPDPFFGVSWKLQARYLAQAFTLARRNPRIDMMIWFLLRDEPRQRGRDGWQSGFFTASGRRKPAFAAFARLPH